MLLGHGCGAVQGCVARTARIEFLGAAGPRLNVVCQHRVVIQLAAVAVGPVKQAEISVVVQANLVCPGRERSVSYCKAAHHNTPRCAHTRRMYASTFHQHTTTGYSVARCPSSRSHLLPDENACLEHSGGGRHADANRAGVS